MTKYFKISDKSGHGIIASKLPESHFTELFDLEDRNWDDMPLSEFLEECYIGDVWENAPQKIECTHIY